MNAIKLRVKYDSDPAAVTPEVQAALDKYVFYHNIELAPGIRTRGIPWTDLYVPPYLDVCRKFDFSGKRVLDAGCRDGAASLIAEKLGAAEVYSLDNSYSPGLVNFIIPFLHTIINPIEANLYDLEKLELGTFDIILCAGLLYHLQFPFWGLRALRDALNPGGLLILETAFIEALKDLPTLVYATGKTALYEPTSPTYFNVAGLQNALSELGFGEFEVHHTLMHGAPADASIHFPLHAKHFGELVPVVPGRIILTCWKLAGYRNPLIDVFEKTVPWDGAWAQRQIAKYSKKSPDEGNAPSEEA
jgi:tRNA (mo5U34)-methyltransferase